MNSNSVCPSNMHHYGVIFRNGSPGSWDAGAATFGHAFIDPDNPTKVFLFYSGASDASWSHGAIGLAISRDGVQFRRIRENPILEGTKGSFCAKEALTPAVVKVESRYYMMFSGRASKRSSRIIGIAYADDPIGPWKVVGELIKPTEAWEGRDIDNGPGLACLKDGTILIYYSNVSSKLTSMKRVLRKFLHRGYGYGLTRRIGILKVKIRGMTKSRIQVLRYKNNPLNHLNGSKGDWNESVFCPGYISIEKAHHMFAAASTYSVGYPYRQYISMISGATPFFMKNETKFRKLIDGPVEKNQIVSHIGTEIALDSPSPILRLHENKLYLYYSVMDRKDKIWKIALSTTDT